MGGSAPARAGVYTYVNRVPVTVGPYQVLQGSDFKLPTPAADGRYRGSENAALLKMTANVTDADGRSIPIQRLMLHHIVFLNAGNPAAGNIRRDATCDTLTFPDNKTSLPAMADRFYSTGEERSVFDLPLGYGYKIRGDDRWGMLFMVMNHRAVTDRAFIEYRVTYATGTDAEIVEGVRPFWLDVNNCKADPYFDVPGTGPPGTTVKRKFVWTAPESMRLVAGQGHVHGGAKILRIRQLDCDGRTAINSTPTWGAPDHPFYRVTPILHEPGPINMTRFHSPQGIAVAKGQRVELEAEYDNSTPHARVMATFIGTYAPDDTITPEIACGKLPPVRYQESAVPGRSETPRVVVPLTQEPTGPFEPLAGGTIRVTEPRFDPRRIELKSGDSLRWKFDTPDGNDTLHDVTVANGPEGFSGPHLNAGRSFSRRFDRPGTYGLYCSLHPMTMVQQVKVTP
ncbi:MAG: plastocyanin/azurin family copper-binding protein [Solirubrobacterales bacterium]